MCTFLRATLFVGMFFFSGSSLAGCHVTLSYWGINPGYIKTEFEDKLLGKRYVSGSVERDTVASALEAKIGCRVPGFESLKMEVGYVPRITIGTVAHVAVGIGEYSLPFSVRRQVDASVVEYSAAYSFGKVSDYVRPYAELKYVKVHGKASASVGASGYWISKEDERRLSGVMVGVGLTAQLTKKGTELVLGYIPLGKNAYIVSLGLTAQL